MADTCQIYGLLEDINWGMRQHLQKIGIRGKRGNCNECPVARLISKEYPETEYVEAGLGYIAWKNKDIKTNFSTTIPYGVQHFMRRFDEGSYPELDENEYLG